MSKVATPPMAHSTTPVKVPHDKIAMRAYEKWMHKGKPHGTHLQDWLEAERELVQEFNRTGSMPGRR